ncbi:serine/threonine protein kinase [Teratosphaeria destructans]|uniref:Serine/threonine protein kinase n=1 Tax=Teratosphaeria destructans TaxID=418781 RepID=A0A9W7SK65_9PEZI|nr:serine/threonine protein kinase [Teratosphaeria destructans]
MASDGLDVGNIDGGNIDGENVDGGNIDSGNIDGGNNDGGNINDGNINARSIDSSIDGGSVDGGSVDGGSSVDTDSDVDSDTYEMAGFDDDGVFKDESPQHEPQTSLFHAALRERDDYGDMQLSPPRMASAHDMNVVRQIDAVIAPEEKRQKHQAEHDRFAVAAASMSEDLKKAIMDQIRAYSSQNLITGEELDDAELAAINLVELDPIFLARISKRMNCGFGILDDDPLDDLDSEIPNYQAGHTIYTLAQDPELIYEGPAEPENLHDMLPVVSVGEQTANGDSEQIMAAMQNTATQLHDSYVKLRGLLISWPTDVDSADLVWIDMADERCKASQEAAFEVLQMGGKMQAAYEAHLVADEINETEVGRLADLGACLGEMAKVAIMVQVDGTREEERLVKRGLGWGRF